MVVVAACDAWWRRVMRGGGVWWRRVLACGGGGPRE